MIFLEISSKIKRMRYKALLVLRGQKRSKGRKTVLQMQKHFGCMRKKKQFGRGEKFDTNLENKKLIIHSLLS